MTGEIVNLRRARKQRTRMADEAAAVARRAAFGRSKADMRLTAAEEALAATRLSAHQREPMPEPLPDQG